MPSGGLIAVIPLIAILASILYRVPSKTTGGYSVTYAYKARSKHIFLVSPQLFLVMPALLDRPNQNVWSLWSWVDGRYHHMDTSTDEAAIRLKAESLRRIFTNRRFRVVGGASMPKD